MKKTSFLFILLLSFIPACQEANGRSEGQEQQERSSSGSLKKALQELVDDPVLEKGRIGFLAKELQEGKELASHRAEEGFVPASTQKLVTTFGALELLGPEHRFKTVFGYSGSIENGTLKGNLILRGGGDPAFLSEEFRDHYGSSKEVFKRLAKACKLAGIERVDGDLLVNASYFPSNTLSRGRIWEDMGNYFGAFPSGLNLMENAFALKFQTPDKPGKSSKIIDMKPDIPWLRLENRVQSSELQKDRAYIYGKPYDEKRIVEGTLPKGRNAYTIEGSIPDPARTAAWLTHRGLEKNGISISGSHSSFRIEGIKEAKLQQGIDTLPSPITKRIVQQTNFHSKNLFAETLLLEMGKAMDTIPKPRPAAKALLDQIGTWGIDAEGIRMEDGSGLAPTNRLTPEFLVELLEKAWNGPHRKAIKNSLPVAGESGSMRYVANGSKASGRIWAKSGSMQDVRAYAGYVEGRTGRTKAFAIIANGFTCSGSEMREKMENVMIEMVE